MTEPTHDVFISHDRDEADLAARLRADLTRAGLDVAADSVFSPGAVASARVIVALQSRYKPPDPVRAALATAQMNDQPTVTAYIRDGRLALRRNADAAAYDDYDAGAAALIYAVWAALGDPRGQAVAETPLEPGERLSDWLTRVRDETSP